MEMKFKFPIGSYVYDMTNKCYAVVLDNYGNDVDGDGGEIRLDSDGNQPIFILDEKYKETGYNLVPLGEESEVDANKLYVAFQAMNDKFKEALKDQCFYVENFESPYNSYYSNNPQLFLEYQIQAVDKSGFTTFVSRLESYEFLCLSNSKKIYKWENKKLTNAQIVYEMLVIHRKLMLGKYWEVVKIGIDH